MHEDSRRGLRHCAATTGLSLVDAVALVFVGYRVARANARPLGESLHGLIALLLLVGLFLGVRMASEMRALVGEAANVVRAIPGFGTKLLVILAAWYLMRRLRTRSGFWIELAIPRRLHAKIVPVVEGLRAALMVGSIAWLAEDLFDERSPATPWLVQRVRAGDASIAGLLQ